MGSETTIVPLLGIALGFLVSYIILARFKMISRLENRDAYRILKDPKKIKEKLDESCRKITGKEDSAWVDGCVSEDAEEIRYDVIIDPKTGKEVLKEIRTKIKDPAKIKDLKKGKAFVQVPEIQERPVKIKPLKDPNNKTLDALDAALEAARKEEMRLQEEIARMEASGTIQRKEGFFTRLKYVFFPRRIRPYN